MSYSNANADADAEFSIWPREIIDRCNPKIIENNKEL